MTARGVFSSWAALASSRVRCDISRLSCSATDAEDLGGSKAKSVFANARFDTLPLSMELLACHRWNRALDCAGENGFWIEQPKYGQKVREHCSAGTSCNDADQNFLSLATRALSFCA